MGCGLWAVCLNHRDRMFLSLVWAVVYGRCAWTTNSIALPGLQKSSWFPQCNYSHFKHAAFDLVLFLCIRFPAGATSFILQQFSQYGNILKHIVSNVFIFVVSLVWDWKHPKTCVKHGIFKYFSWYGNILKCNCGKWVFHLLVVSWYGDILKHKIHVLVVFAVWKPIEMCREQTFHFLVVFTV